MRLKQERGQIGQFLDVVDNFAFLSESVTKKKRSLASPAGSVSSIRLRYPADSQCGLRCLEKRLTKSLETGRTPWIADAAVRLGHAVADYHSGFFGIQPQASVEGLRTGSSPQVVRSCGFVAGKTARHFVENGRLGGFIAGLELADRHGRRPHKRLRKNSRVHAPAAMDFWQFGRASTKSPAKVG